MDTDTEDMTDMEDNRDYQDKQDHQDNRDYQALQQEDSFPCRTGELQSRPNNWTTESHIY